MKIDFFSALALLLCAPFATAQFKGEKYFGGTIGVITSSNGYEGEWSTYTSFAFAPECGYFVSDRLRLSGFLSYQLSTAEIGTAHALSVGPSLAYYVRLCDRLYYTPELEVKFTYETSEYYNTYSYGAGLWLGAFEFRPTSHIGLSFNILSLSYVRSSGLNNLIFNLVISPSVGFKYYF